MDANDRFEQYLGHVADGLGHADRHAGLQGYCTGLALPLSRKSVEPMAARVDPLHASAKHQALHHFVAKAEWSDDEMLRRVAQWVVPHMDLSRGGFWIVDDTGFPKQGIHSVGVARQYCGMLGKQDNCQVAVSVSLAASKAACPWPGACIYRTSGPKTLRVATTGVPRRTTKRRSRLQPIEALLRRVGLRRLACGRRRLWHGHRLCSASARAIPSIWSYSASPAFQSDSKNPALSHSRKRLCTALALPKRSLGQGVPLAARAQPVQDGYSNGPPSRPSQPMAIHARGQRNQ